jgi:transposase
MKFKQRDAQNQRIEKITADHLVIGIDIAKEIQVARAVTYRGIELGKPCSFTNDLFGFQQFRSWIQALQREHCKTHAIIGMEPTGHYWLNLAHWLLEQQCEVVVVNPYHVKLNKENRDNSPTKNDVKDALVIADMVKSGYYSSLRLPTGKFEELRILFSSREFAVKQFISVQNQVHRWLDIWFPEYHHVFTDWTCKSSLATLQLFPLPADLKCLSAKEIYAAWKPIMRRRGSYSFAVALQEYAHLSVGATMGSVQAKQSLAFLLAQFHSHEEYLTQLEIEMLTLLQEIPQAIPILAISGMGTVLVASILSETGDLRGFSHGQQVMRLAGLHLSEVSSGLHKGQARLTKRGRPKLRKMLFLTVLNLVKHNPEFRELHQHNTKIKKMKKIHSIIKLCGKLARILVAMTNQNESYISGKYTVQLIAAA